MDKTLVSVVMSTYLEPLPYVAEAVSSILNQTYSNLEFLIHVDDKNNQPVLDYLQTLEKKDGRVRVFVHDEPQGLAVCRNAGIQLATGEYIALMDADDIAVESRIEKQFLYLTSNNADAVFSQVEYINEQGINLSFFTPVTQKPNRDIFLRHLFAHPTGFFKKNIFAEEQYDPAFSRAQDVDLWLRLLAKDKTFRIIPQVLLKYRIHAGESIEQRLDRQSAYAKYGFRIVKKHFSKNIFNPYFWYFSLRWSFFYAFYTLTPQSILRFLVRIKDEVKAR